MWSQPISSAQRAATLGLPATDPLSQAGGSLPVPGPAERGLSRPGRDYVGGGSIGIIGAARAAHAVVRHPDDPDHRLLTTVRSNLAGEAPTWGFSLLEVPHLGVARVDWDTEPDQRNATDLLAGGQTPALADAVTWLTDWRNHHPGEVPAADLVTDAAKAGIPHSTLHRARKQIGLRSRRSGDGWSIF